MWMVNNVMIFQLLSFSLMHGLRAPNEAFFFIEIQNFWADNFWGICGIFGQNISIHFGTVSPLSMFSINKPLFLQKESILYPNPEYLPIWDWDLNLGPSSAILAFSVPDQLSC